VFRQFITTSHLDQTLGLDLVYCLPNNANDVSATTQGIYVFCQFVTASDCDETLAVHHAICLPNTSNFRTLESRTPPKDPTSKTVPCYP
jgi:hypothetical protein